MSSVLSMAASGMAAAQKRLEVSARNVASVSARPSDDQVAAAFAALRLDQVETSGGGTAAVVRSTPPGTDIDLAGEAVQLMVARYTFAANAKVARIAGDMHKALLDVTA
jgi:flagellar basal-body rod protein FlgC